MAVRRPPRVSSRTARRSHGFGHVVQFLGRAVEPLIEIRCGECSRVFHVCGPDYRNQRYCTDACRQRGRRRQVREARRRHRQSPEGRADHRDRMRAYRRAHRISPSEASSISVVDQSSPSPRDSDRVPPPIDSTDESTSPREVHHVAPFRRPTVQRCIVCGRHSHFVIPIGEPRPRRRRTARGPP